jgi:hypothetical protein
MTAVEGEVTAEGMVMTTTEGRLTLKRNATEQRTLSSCSGGFGCMHTREAAGWLLAVYACLLSVCAPDIPKGPSLSGSDGSVTLTQRQGLSEAVQACVRGTRISCGGYSV